jgi:hypothetical protein
MTTTNEPAGIDLDKLEALARKAYLANEVVAMIPPAKILDLIAQSRASQPEGATLASQEGITGTSQEETTGASESSQKLRGWLKGTVVTLPADFLHSVADELDDLRAQLAATTENLQTAVRQAWEANAELSKLRAVPGDSGFRKALEDILAMRGKGDCASDLIDIADSALAGLYATSPASQPVAPEAAHADDRQDMAREEMLEPCRHNPVSACGLPLKAAHAQQEAAPAEVTKSQERDYNWLLGLAKSKGYQTVYGALYAAPTAVPYLGILPSHSEREAANAGGRIIVPEWVYRSARDLAVSIWRDNYKDTAPQWEPLDDLAGVVSQIDNMVTGMRRVTGAGNRPEITDDELVAFNRFCECAEDFDSGGHDVPKEMMKRLAVIGLVRPCGFGRHETTLFGDAVRNGNAPATIAAGQEAANAKDAAHVTYTCKGKGGVYSLIGVAYGAGTSRDTTVNLYREVGTGVMYFRTPADFHDRMERINAAMAAVGEAGQEGGDK